MRKPMTFEVDGRRMTVREIREHVLNIHDVGDGHIRGRLNSGDDKLAHLLRPVNTSKDVIVSPTKDLPSESFTREISDGSTAGYYQLPEEARELQDLISHKNMNAQVGTIFSTCYRYGGAAHSDMLRDARKMKFYIDAEIKRLEKL